MKKLLIIIFLFSKGFTQEMIDKSYLNINLGTHTYKKSGVLSYDEWTLKKEVKNITVADYNRVDFPKVKLVIRKEETIFYDDPYIIDLYINKVLVHSHYVTEVSLRDDRTTYDILSGENIFTVNFTNKTLVIFYGFNFNIETFKSIYVFFN